MGRNYYCDYCDKRVRNDIQIRKKHIQGLQHQTAQSEHYAKFKDLKSILQTEMRKTACSKFQQNSCKFGAFCRFSHYTSKQLSELQDQVYQLDCKAWIDRHPKHFDESTITNFIVERSKTKISDNLRSNLKQPATNISENMQKNSNLPPSLHQIDPFEDFIDITVEWGR